MLHQAAQVIAECEHRIETAKAFNGWQARYFADTLHREHAWAYRLMRRAKRDWRAVLKQYALHNAHVRAWVMQDDDMPF